MKIFCIPFEKIEGKVADARLKPIIIALSRENQIIGVQKPSDFNPNKKLTSYLEYLYYMLRAFLFGIRHHKDIDLIVCENQDAPYALVGGILSLIIRKPCIWDSHGNILAACREAGTSKLLTFILTFCERISKKLVKVMVVPTEVDKKLYVEQYFKADNLLVIPCGVDLKHVDELSNNKTMIRKKIGLDAGKTVLVFVGGGPSSPNIKAVRWINDELAPAVTKEFCDVQILIVGPMDILPSIHPAITFTGFVNDVYEYIHAADLCIAPVRLENGISTKVLDYMACAKPMVISSSVVKGTPQLKDGDNALIAKDHSEFISKTLYILKEPEQAKRMGINARKIIEEHYNWKILADEWNRLVKKTVQR